MFSTQSVVQLIFTTTERTSLPIRHFAWVLAQNLHDTVPLSMPTRVLLCCSVDR
jgi:hypothetical protein